MALGAPRLAVLRLIVGEGMTVGLMGIGAGLLSAFALSRALASLVFAVPVHDPATFAASAIVLTLVALAACTAPARRASRVDPDGRPARRIRSRGHSCRNATTGSTFVVRCAGSQHASNATSSRTMGTPTKTER